MWSAMKSVDRSAATNAGWCIARRWNGSVVWIPLTWGVFQHTLSGVRHLVMDIGAGYELPVNRFWATMTMVAAVLLTGAFWLWILYGRLA